MTEQVRKILNSKYGYNPGSYADLKYNRRSYKFFARLDYNPSEEHRLMSRDTYSDAWDDNSPSGGGKLSSNEWYKYLDATDFYVPATSEPPKRGRCDSGDGGGS